MNYTQHAYMYNTLYTVQFHFQNNNTLCHEPQLYTQHMHSYTTNNIMDINQLISQYTIDL